MSFMRDFFGGFAEGIVNGAAKQLRDAPTNGRASGHGRIERLCRELGWSVDQRDENGIVLYFSSSDGDKRKVRIAGGDKTLVGFSTFSYAVLAVRQVSSDLLAYLLQRNFNESGIGTWSIIVEDDEVSFHLCYTSLGEGLDAPTLQYICESLANEAGDFDDKLRNAGVLE